MDKVFVIYHHQSDECTYSLEIVHAICTDEVRAIEAQEEAQKEVSYIVEIKEVQLNKVYPAGII